MSVLASGRIAFPECHAMPRHAMPPAFRSSTWRCCKLAFVRSMVVFVVRLSRRRNKGSLISSHLISLSVMSPWLLWTVGRSDACVMQCNAGLTGERASECTSRVCLHLSSSDLPRALFCQLTQLGGAKQKCLFLRDFTEENRCIVTTPTATATG